jgi:hypothetical protein
MKVRATLPAGSINREHEPRYKGNGIACGEPLAGEPLAGVPLSACRSRRAALGVPRGLAGRRPIRCRLVVRARCRLVVRARRGLGLRLRRTAAVARKIRFARRRSIHRRPRPRWRIRSRRRIGPRRWWWRLWPRRRPRTARRRRPMHPVVFSPIPRPASIVAAPVIANAERHDADPQTRTELNDGNAAVLIIEEKKITVDPAAVALKVHIAPSPVVETTVHVQQSVGWQGENQRIVGTRPGA